jgi:HAE1 family hydrophobic/amphiphilic exporter-1
VDFPIVSVTATLPGASAEELETTVTKVLEEAINTVSGLDELRSTTREGVASIVAQFVLEKDVDVASQEVRDKVSSVTRQLPEGMETPIINKFDFDAAPVMTIAVSGARAERDVTEIADNVIREGIQTVSGVGAVTVSGGQRRAINVILDIDRLASFGLSAEEVRLAVAGQNLELPGGIVEQGDRELVLRTLGRIHSAEGFNDVVVANRNGFPIRIRDIGRAEDSVETPRGITRLDGRNAVSLFVQKQSGNNTIKISDAVQQRLAEIRPTLPADIEIEIIKDQSVFIRESMHEVQFHLLLAAVLVSGAILLFIRDCRTTLIATVAIPTSILPTFLFMQYMDFTLNNITMLALILAIGIVIDDAVVVHENIFRRMEEDGLDAVTAASKGTSEIALAVLATSISLVVIFLPVAFMGGIIGRFFSSFGLTVAFAIVMSLFVSFTLTPMLCAKYLKLDTAHGDLSHSKAGWLYRFVDGGYGLALRWALRHRFVTAALCILVMLSTVPIAKNLGVNMMPRDDQSEFQVSFVTPEDFTLRRTDEVIRDFESRLTQLPGVIHCFTVIGENMVGGKGQGDVTRGSIHIRLIGIKERRYSQFDVMELARGVLADYPDLRTAVSDVSAVGTTGGDGRTFQLSIQGTDLQELAGLSETLTSRLDQTGGFVDVDTTLALRKPEVQVVIDRDAASDLGVSVQTVSSTLNMLVGGQIVSRFKDGNEQYDVWLRADEQFRGNPQILDQLTVPSSTAGLVQLASFATLPEARGPNQIERFDRQRTVNIKASPNGISLNEAVQRAQTVVNEVGLPPGYKIVFGGQAKTLGETAYYFAIALGMSILLMYMVLAAQFESWVHPVSILVALPVTVPFGLVSLLLFNTPMDLYAMFGLFMLIGIVKKNGILQVDATNQLRAAGIDRDAAVLQANHTRLRPILMTTVMLIAAMVPIALGEGPGAGARASMAKVIIGGQSLSLILALLVTPVAYSLFDSARASLTRCTGVSMSAVCTRNTTI